MLRPTGPRQLPARLAARMAADQQSTLPLPEGEVRTLCDPTQLAACRGMLSYCEGSTASHKRSGYPTTSGMRSLLGSELTYVVNLTTEDLPELIEDPDDRPYIWDLED